jgi:hypothetical protein
MSASSNLPTELALQVRALQAVAPAEAEVRAAQRELEDVVETRLPAPRRFMLGRWAAAAAAGLMAVVLGLLLPTAGPSVAFAEVQRHFQVFRTLSFVLETRMHGQTIQESHVYVNEAGDVRTDVGKDLTVLVSASRKEVLMLAHGPRTAMKFPIDAAANAEDPLAWLEEIRAYQSAARSLGTQVVDGRTVHGWELEIQGMQSELWADENGLPLWMQMNQQGMELRMQFTFDQPLAASLFSLDLPRGYIEGTPDEP